MDEYTERLAKVESQQQKHSRDIESLSKKTEAMESSLVKLTDLTKAQNGELRVQTNQLKDIHDAILGTIDGKQPGLVHTVTTLTKWKDDVLSLCWTALKPLIGLVGIAAVLGIAYVILHGMKP